MPNNGNLAKLSRRYEREAGLFLMIFAGYYTLISDIGQQSYLISLISMNFTVASIVLAILSFSKSLNERGLVYLKYSSRLLIVSAISLFYLSATAFNKSTSLFEEIFMGFIEVGSTGLFTLGVYFLLLGSFELKPESNMSLKEAYLQSSTGNGE